MTDESYKSEVEQAIKKLEEVKARGEESLSDEWEQVRKEIFSPEEIAASDLRVSIVKELIKARKELGISQYKLGELSGIKQSAIARLERGSINPKLETIQKLLAPLGKRLAVVSA